MRTVWGVLALLIVATAATVAVRIGIPSSATRLPGPITVPAATAGRLPAATPAGAGSDRSSSTGRAVEVVTPDRPVSSLPAPIGSDSREAEQLKPRAGPSTTTPSTPATTIPTTPATTTPSAPPATDR